MNCNSRLEHLQSKETLTSAEMEELIKLSPPGTFKALPAMANFKNIGVIDLSKAIDNFKAGAEKSRIALQWIMNVTWK